MKKLLFFIFFVLFLWWLTPWLFCHGFKGPYYFSKYTLGLDLGDLVHNDIGMPFLLIRFYHNKIILFVMEFMASVLRFADVTFLVQLISLGGVFGLLCFLYYFSKETLRKPYIKFLLILVVLFPFAEALVRPAISFPVKIALFALPLEILSLSGFSKLLKVQRNSKKTFLLMILILWLSVWWFRIFPLEAFNFCQ